MKQQIRPPVPEENPGNRLAGGGIQVEGAIDKLELQDAAGQQPLQRRQKRLQRKLPDGHIDRGLAEFTGEWAAARGLKGDVPIVIPFAGQGDLVQIRAARQ